MGISIFGSTLTNRDGSICSKEHIDNFILDTFRLNFPPGDPGPPSGNYAHGTSISFVHTRSCVKDVVLGADAAFAKPETYEALAQLSVKNRVVYVLL